MRLGRFQISGQERIGLFQEDTVRDITHEFSSFSEAIAHPGEAQTVEGDEYDQSKISFLPPITNRNRIFCAALNYEAHAEEAGNEVPDPPLIFLKLPQTLVGHKEPISYHASVTQEIDYEAELAAVVGKSARHVTPSEALDFIAGYTILNDTSARDLQFGLTVGDDDLLDWFSGKAMRHTTPTGPTVVINEVDDPQNLDINSKVNGETLQDDNTQMMINPVAELVSFISTRVELTPGDIIATGTPEGVGTFQDIKLMSGDTVEIEIESIGTLANTVSDVTPAQD